jgi:hypothetical protein
MQKCSFLFSAGSVSLCDDIRRNCRSRDCEESLISPGDPEFMLCPQGVRY